jgi:hypothetical protein
MSFLDQIDPNQRPQIPLSPGTYGSSKEPGLKIIQYIEKASKPDKSGAMRHSFLVSATRPSREAVEGFNQKNFDPTNPIDGPDFEGTAFLAVTLHKMWLNPEAAALAFTENSRNREGVVQADHVAASIQAGETSAESIENARAYFRQLATDKVMAANTPTESIEEAVDTQYKKELQQISIKLGEFLSLCDWANQPRNLNTDVRIAFLGCQFAGKVETSTLGRGGSEVSRVFSRSKQSAA